MARRLIDSREAEQDGRPLVTIAELQREHLLARMRGDEQRAGLMQGCIVRRILEAQRRARSGR